MKSIQGINRKLPTIASLVTFLILGVYLFRYSLPLKAFSETLLIYDLIWLDAWSLAFCFIIAVIWLSSFSWRTKALLGLAALSIYGYIEISLILDGTPFSMNAYWGDQKFRLAMITNLKDLGWPSDFYYRQLPLFYPPLLYYALALLARLGSWEAYEMLKIGGLLIYLIGPFVLHFLWRPLVGNVRAWLVVLFTFLIGSFGVPYPLAAPHAFVASVAFIPWWLYYVEQVRRPLATWRFYLTGGIIGAAIFSVYFYPFFLGGFILLLRATVLRWFMFWRPPHFKWGRALGVLAASALLSAPYWLPVLWSVLANGMDRSRGGWHHIDSVGIVVLFQQLTIPGLLSLAGIVFAITRRRRPTCRGLLILAAGLFPFLLLGSILGAVDSPINLAKARDFANVLAGPFIGIAAAAGMRWRSSARTRWIVPVLLWLAVVVLCQHFNVFARHPFVKTARTAHVPEWNTDAEEMAERSGKVSLSGYEELFSFYPIYAYIAANEHYSHPAARFKERYDLLWLLEPLKDQHLFNIALRGNRYDAVDYFMPRAGDGTWDVTVSVSNYPDRHSSKIFRFSKGLTEDSSLFRKEAGDNLFAVLNPPLGVDMSPDTTGPIYDDSLVFLMRAAMIRDHLDEEGRAELDRYLKADWTGWHRLVSPDKPWTFGDSLRLIDFRVGPVGDSLCLMFGFDAPRTVRRRYKVMCHIAAGEEFYNYDFWPSVPTNTWQKWGTYVVRRNIPKPDEDFRCFIGFFDKDFHLPGDFKIDCTGQGEPVRQD